LVALIVGLQVWKCNMASVLLNYIRNFNAYGRSVWDTMFYCPLQHIKNVFAQVNI